MSKEIEAPLAGWTIRGDYYVRDDGLVRVNVSHAPSVSRPFALYYKSSEHFPIWAPRRYATAQNAMRAAGPAAVPPQPSPAATVGEVTRTEFLYEGVREAAEAVAAYDRGVGFSYDIKSIREGYAVLVRDGDGYRLGYLRQRGL